MEILNASLSQGKLVNPLHSEDEKITNILCTWNQMFKAMELAEKEWSEIKVNDSIFLESRLEKIKGNLPCSTNDL